MKLFFFSFMALLSSFAQSQTIRGRIEEKGKPLSIVNVLLLKISDSALVSAAITNEEGNYSISNIKPGTYIIKVTRIGYMQQFSEPFHIVKKSDQFELPSISLTQEPKELARITITGKRPFIEQKIDRMVVNVANSIIATGSTALEVLEKSPGIIIDRQNEQIIFKGKEGVIVQIDGKQTYLSMSDLVSLLSTMPSDNVDRIELITNPSAKYDAAGNAGIIDIKLKKNNNIGTNGLISFSIGSGRFGRERGGFQINHRTNRFNAFGNYNINRENTSWDFNITRSQADSVDRNYVESLSFIRFRNRGHNAKAGIDYFLNSKTTLGAVWTGNWSRNRENSPAEVIFRKAENADPYLHLMTDKSILNIQSNQLFNINLQHNYSSKGQISADIDYGIFHRTFDNRLNTQTLIPYSPGQPHDNLLSYMPTTINIFTVKTDYTRALTKGWKLEAGLKASDVKADNDMTISRGSNGNLQIDSLLSNHFKYTEDVYAGYISFGGKAGAKTDMLLGVRAEETHSVANSLTLKNVVAKNYLKFFPSAFITRAVNVNNSLTFSYSYRIDRPNYQSLNPARSYLDPYTFSEGNSYLTPQYSHTLEIRHGYKNKLFTSIGATFVNDLMFFVLQPVDAKSAMRKPENIGSSQAYNLTISFPVTLMKGWTMQNTLMGNYSRFNYVYRNTPIKVESFSGTLNSSNGFVFGKGWTGELSGKVNTPAVYALFRSPWMGSMDIGIQKSFLQNWKAKLNLQDVFRSSYIDGKIDAANFQNHVVIRFDSRVIMFNITYAFGNQQLKNSRQHKAASEEELQRTD